MTRILYVASMSENGTARQRFDALRRLGHDVTGHDTDPVWRAGTWPQRYLRHRIVTGPAVSRANQALRDAASSGRYDAVWMDKAIFVTPETVRAIRATGALAVHYNPDNPFGPRRDPGWRVFLKSLPYFDVHIVPRACNVADYRDAGAARVLVMPFTYEPTIHFPPPPDWDDARRDRDVVFIGTPHDRRPQFIDDLWTRHGLRVAVRGSRWPRYLTAEQRRRFYEGGPIYRDAYREHIWRARIALAFVTHSNNDPTARRCFEIAGCGGFMLAERTDMNRELFAEGNEAAFFSDVDECAELIKRYLPDEPARRRIARAARLRAETSGYSNDARLKTVLAEIGTR